MPVRPERISSIGPQDGRYRGQPEPLVRPCRPEDLPEILAIEEAWPTAPGWSRAQFEREMSSERSRLLVLEEEGMLRAYAGFWSIPPEAQVTTLVVAPEAAGRGLGRLLLEGLLKTCRHLGLERVTLEVSSANERALRLYRRAGFRIVGRRPKFYNDSSDAILMDLSLGPQLS